jgi:hypothetical protein
VTIGASRGESQGFAPLMNIWKNKSRKKEENTQNISTKLKVFLKKKNEILILKSSDLSVKIILNGLP